MALPTFKTKAEIPKGFEEEYEEVEGEWHPIDHTTKLSKALKDEREKREAAEGVARKAATEAAQLQARAQAAAAGMTDAELKKLYAQIEENIRKEYEPKLKEAETLGSENRTLKLTTVVKGMFRSAGALQNKLDDFWKLHGDEFDLTKDGKPMVIAEPGKDVAKHVAMIVKGRGEWAQGTRASGGGAGTTQPTQVVPGSGVNGQVTFDDLVKNPASAVVQANQA
jgi:hypothetical protein